MTTNWIAVVAGLACVSTGAMADQPGQAAFAGINSRVGGARMSLPSPNSGLGRQGTLLNRGGSLLPPTPAPAPRPIAAARPAQGTINPGSYFPAGVNDRPCGVHPTPSGGTTVDGFTSTDNFRLRFHLGSGICNTDCGVRPLCYQYPVSWWYGSYWNNWYNEPSLVYSGPWYGTDPFVANGTPGPYQPAASQPAAPAPTPREATPIEKADAYWQSGRVDQAVVQLKDYLHGAPDDTDAMRFLALALIDEKKTDEGVAMMAMAYEKTPQLGSRVLPIMDIPGGEHAMRKRVNAVSTYANRVKTSSSWLTLAVLIQSEGREPVAKTIVGKAKLAGLGAHIAKEMDAGLGG